MASPYFVEVRTGGKTKSKLRDIINDVADEFGVREIADPRAVPHIPLFGRYDTNQGAKIKETLIETLSAFDVVPYRISGFDEFDERHLIYANVEPSPELCLLRHRISEALRPLAYSYPQRDEQSPYEFYIPIAQAKDGGPFDTAAVLDFLNRHYDVAADEYATRITSLDERQMLWEYDLLQDRVLGHDEATARQSWKRTESLLEERSSDLDHKCLVEERVGPAIATARREGWKYFAEPHDHVKDRARKDGLYQADTTARQRELYFGENYVYLVFAGGQYADGIHVFSQEKSDYFDATIETQCPICETNSRQHERTRLLPCRSCGFQYDLPNGIADRETPTADEIAEMCVRCKRPIRSGGIAFSQRVYCEDCVSRFEAVAESGVVVRSSHDERDDEDVYVVQWETERYKEGGQVAALARGKELADTHGVSGLFVYERRGSHWLLDTYLDAHPEIKTAVTERRRQLRGENRVEIETGGDGTEETAVGYNIRAEGDVFIADTAVKDAVVNRSDIGDGEGNNQP